MALTVRCTKRQRETILLAWKLLPEAEEAAWVALDGVVRALASRAAFALGLASEPLAEDVVQQVHLALVRYLGRKPVQAVTAPGAFVARIVHDEIIDAVRSTLRDSRIFVSCSESLQDIASERCLRAVDAALDLKMLLSHAREHHGFTDSDEEVVNMRYLLPLSLRSVAEKLHTPEALRQESRMRVRVFRALIKLRRASDCSAFKLRNATSWGFTLSCGYECLIS